MREADAVPRKRLLLFTRYVLILTTGAVGVTAGRQMSPWIVALAVVLALASNLFLARVSPLSFFDEFTQSVLLMVDTSLVCGILLLSSADPTSFLFFFVVMVMAAYIENLITLGILTALGGVIAVSFFGSENGFIQVPFMVVAGLYYGYLIQPERAGEWVQRTAWLERGPRERYTLTLFTNGKGSDSVQAFHQVRAICEKHMAGEYRLSVVDVLEEPERARAAKVYATPTLVKERPGQMRSIFGKLSEPERVLGALDLPRKQS